MPGAHFRKGNGLLGRAWCPSAERKSADSTVADPVIGALQNARIGTVHVAHSVEFLGSSVGVLHGSDPGLAALRGCVRDVPDADGGVRLQRRVKAVLHPLVTLYRESEKDDILEPSICWSLQLHSQPPASPDKGVR